VSCISGTLKSRKGVGVLEVHLGAIAALLGVARLVGTGLGTGAIAVFTTRTVLVIALLARCASRTVTILAGSARRTGRTVTILAGSARRTGRTVTILAGSARRTVTILAGSARRTVGVKLTTRTVLALLATLRSETVADIDLDSGSLACTGALGSISLCVGRS